MKNKIPTHPIPPIEPRKPVEPCKESKKIRFYKKIGSFKIDTYSTMSLADFAAKVNEIAAGVENTIIEFSFEKDYDEIILDVVKEEETDNPNYPRRVKEYKEALAQYEEQMPQFEKAKELYDYKVKQFELAMARYYAEKTADYAK